MEDQNRNKEIELRSEEVQEVMSHIPPAVLRYGIGVLSAVVILLLAGSAFFRYPDRVEAELTLTTQSPPAYIIAGNSGRIERLYVANRQDVRKDDLLGVIGNTADTEDMLYLRERLRVWKNSGSRIESVGDLLFNRLPELGSVQASYAACRLAWDNYLQHMQDRIYGTELMNAVASLSVSLAEWEKNYLLTSPVDGQVAFMQLWKPNQNIETGETVFVVIPHDAVVPIGKALLPMESIGKVRVGQRAIIRLPAFPEQEFGFVEGCVSSISPVPDADGNYILEITLPDGMETTYGRTLPLIKEIKGNVSVVMQERSLLDHLLNKK